MLVHELITRGQADTLAIVDHKRRITYKELATAVHNCRNRLYAAGVRTGDRVGIFSRNSADFIFAYMAAASLGAVSVPINFQLSNREIAYIIKDAGIRVLLAHEPLNLIDSLAALRCGLKVVQLDIKTCGKLDKKAAAAPLLPADFDEHKPCAIIYTSGTTGNPKGAVLSHANLITNCQQLEKQGMDCNASRHVLCVLPMYHAFGWTCAVLYALYCGARIIILDSFTPKETIAVIREEQVTDMYVVPSICSLLTKLASPEDMKTLRLVVSGGTILPLQIQQDFIQKFHVDICECYGLSETSPILTINPPSRPIVGSCGKIVPDVRWKIIDHENQEVPLGQTGELVVKGPNVMLGYWNLPDVNQEVMRGGWFHTGDVARADGDNYIYIVDRIKDMIISMGENIYPREVEELIYQFPGIHEAAVIGIEDKLRGQAGACFYSLHPGAAISIRELKKFLQNNLALYKIPREFHEMDKLPRTATGKIAKRKILAAFQSSKKVSKKTEKEVSQC